MKKIDINRLSEAELVDLNHRVVERLRFLQQMRAHAEMLEFSIGDRVCFHAGGHGVVEGMLTRYDRKTVAIIADGGRHWNVSPSLLRRAGSFETSETDSSNVIRLKTMMALACDPHIECLRVLRPQSDCRQLSLSPKIESRDS